MTIQLETLRNNLIMENTQIGEFVNDYRVPIDVFEAVIDTVDEAMKNEPEVVKGLSPLDKIHFMCDKAYKHGVIMGMYLFNESLKATFDDIEKSSDK